VGIRELREEKRRRRIASPAPEAPTPEVPGVGTSLKRILGWLSLGLTGGCKCKERSASLNERGPDWARQNVSLIVDWLWEEKQRQHLSSWEIARAACSGWCSYLWRVLRERSHQLGLLILPLPARNKLDLWTFRVFSRAIVRLAIFLARRNKSGHS
jgi:hypothetical protein